MVEQWRVHDWQFVHEAMQVTFRACRPPSPSLPSLPFPTVSVADGVEDLQRELCVCVCVSHADELTERIVNEIRADTVSNGLRQLRSGIGHTRRSPWPWRARMKLVHADECNGL